MTPRSVGTAIAAMTASSAVFSLMSVLARRAGDVSPATISLYRFSVGLAVLGVMAMAGRMPLSFGRSGLLFLRGLFGGLGVLLYFTALARVGLAKGTVLSYSYPAFAVLAGLAAFRQPVRPAQWLLIVLSFAGIVLVASPEAGSSWGGRYEALAVAGAVFSGVALAIVKKARESESSHAIYFSQCVVGFFLVLLPGSAAPAADGVRGALLLLAIGLTATAAQLLMTYAFRDLSITAGSLIGMLVPVFNAAAGLLFFGERIGPRAAVGMAVVIAACVAVALPKRPE